MTKPKSPSTPLDLLLNGGGVLPDVGARAQAFWHAQAAAAEHVRAFVDEWWERRQVAAASAAECCAKLFSNGADAAASTEAWSDWARDALERSSEDAKAHMALAGSLAADAAKAFGANGLGQAAPAGKGGKGAGAKQSSEDAR